MKKVSIILVLLLSFISAEVTNKQLFKDIEVVTEHAPPFQYCSNTLVDSGFAVDIISEVFKELDISKKITSYPWVRAYNMALHNNNILIFSITRSKEREDKFQWAGELCVLEDYLWALNSHKIDSLLSIEEAKKFITAIPHNDNQHQFLKSLGLKDNKHLYIVPSWDQAIQMLYSNRVDFVMGSELMLMARIKSLNLDQSKIKKVYPLGKMGAGLYFAFNKETSPQIVEHFSQALNQIKEDGRYQKIWDKWTKEK